jgi:hypothetical protein
MCGSTGTRKEALDKSPMKYPRCASTSQSKEHPNIVYPVGGSMAMANDALSMQIMHCPSDDVLCSCNCKICRTTEATNMRVCCATCRGGKARRASVTGGHGDGSRFVVCLSARLAAQMPPRPPLARAAAALAAALAPAAALLATTFICCCTFSSSCTCSNS